MTNPAVSVVLPTHNRLATLSRAVASVLQQSMGDLELIVVDDGSEDSTAAWLAEQSDTRLRVIRSAERQGAARARNRGIASARAELIAFQDSDDEWAPGKLACQLALLQAGGESLGWVGGAYRVADRIVRSASLEAGVGYEAELLRGAPFVTPTWLVRRRCIEAVGSFDENLPCLEDWDLIFRLADQCRFRAVPEVVLVRHSSADSLYADAYKRMAGLDTILARHRERWLKAPALYARWCAEAARLHALHGEPSRSRDWLREALHHHLWQWPALGLACAAFGGDRLLRRVARSRWFTLAPV
jgi:glycosyltransferase involved in cell wall biosynthesis